MNQVNKIEAREGDPVARELRRVSSSRPGHDCVRHPCGVGRCGKDEGGNHGVHCDEWYYALTDGRIALSLTVFSGVFPASVPADVVARINAGREKAAQGTDLVLHTAFTLDRESIRRNHAPRPCDYVLGAGCYFGESSIIAADAFFKLHGADSYEQPESFWAALEREWVERGAAALAARADERWLRCAACDGEGTVPR